MQVQQQLSLLGDSGRTIQVPTAIHKALSAGFALAISVSGGKDSDAMARAIVRWFKQQGFPGRCYLIHAHLGRIEWAGVKTHLKALADALAVPLVFVKRGQGGLIEKWGERRASLERDGRAAPPWSSAACRFCTSDTKVAPINKHMRQHSGVVSAIGLRAEESSSRARKPFCQVRKGITGKAYLDTMAAGDSPEVQADRAVSAFLEDDSKTGRLALDWHSILDWSEGDVWQEMGSSLQELSGRRRLFKQGC
ncbi:phosphoadenosine phosphosulfate reductase family protein [Halomicronema sp. CCY15110]|uniref:phosphoadenosine phosphosulfate reductase domain-containing protein n=1 Tax=Halomicronema sp. CCY15110 TaxID=2767773 RepID=UPI001950F676|nr:phosphoadenosine phosphosulfate reductase family protein [Halomicronema sp. CCY15110]